MTPAELDTLSGPELRARLINRGLTADHADHLARNRDLVEDVLLRHLESRRE